MEISITVLFTVSSVSVSCGASLVRHGFPEPTTNIPHYCHIFIWLAWIHSNVIPGAHEISQAWYRIFCANSQQRVYAYTSVRHTAWHVLRVRMSRVRAAVTTRRNDQKSLVCHFAHKSQLSAQCTRVRSVMAELRFCDNHMVPKSEALYSIARLI